MKLVRILKGDDPIPRKRWGIERILATIVCHRRDPRLRTPYRQFKRFAYRTMLEESLKEEEEAGRWPDALKRHDWDTIIKLRAKREIEKRYNQEIQALCRTPCFGTAETNEMPQGSVDKSLLDDIANTAIQKAPFVSSMVFSVGPTVTNSLYTTPNHAVTMKLIAILVILCRSAHRNNSNYLPLMIGLYLYSAGARIDAITLLNRLGLSVSYSVLLKKLGDITVTSQQWIRQQASNRQLVGTWDNFEYQENVNEERIGDRVKFRSITMAL